MTIKLRLVPRAALIARVSPHLAATVQGGDGVSADYSGGVWTVGLDTASLVEAATIAAGDRDNIIVATYNEDTDTYRKVAIDTLVGVGSIAQAWDADLDALAALSSTGIPVRTASNTWAQRSVAAGSMLGVSNGDGVSGNPTVSVTDAELLAIGGLTSAADKGIQFTGSGTASTYDLTSAGKALLDDADNTAQRVTLGLVIGTDVQAYDADLAALAANSTDGFWAHTGAGTGAARSLANAAAGITWTNPAGIAGNPTPVLANDLAALEGLSSTGFAARTTTDTWAQRSLQAPAAGITITNPAGVAGDPTLVLANDLSALEGLSSTGIARRTGADAWSVGTLVTNAELATAAAYTLKGNATGSTASVTDISIPALTLKASPVSGDIVLLVDSAASNALKYTTAGALASAGSVASIGGSTGVITLAGGLTISANILTDGWTAGDAKLTFKTTADTGWIMADDGSIGDGSSSATTRANADTSALFTILYNNITALVVQDSSGSTVARGANAAADFAAHRRLVIPKTLGRSIAIAGAGSGLTSRTLGATAGAETETPTTAKTAAHTHGPSSGTFVLNDSGGQPFGVVGSSSVPLNISSSATASTGSGTALNILDPSTYMNVMIKL